MISSDEEYRKDFPDEEIDRRRDEVARRMLGRPRTMNFTTGQNLRDPLLSADELRTRGYSGKIIPNTKHAP